MRRLVLLLLFVAAAPLFAQEEKPQPATMGFEEYEPKIIPSIDADAFPR